MATTLIIKAADFSANKLTTVSFDGVPCTAIAINDASYSMTSIGGTQNVDYTVTPENTTDTIRWGSSDESVATVVNGVITAVGLGTATITVTCGSHSDTCSVSVSAAYNPTWVTGKQAYKAATAQPVMNYLSSQALGAAAFGSATSGTYQIYGTSGAYPYPIPEGATKISITASGMYIGMWFSDSSTSSYSSSASIVGDGNNASSSAGVADSHTYTIPEGADCFAMTVRLKSGANISASDLENVTVSFLTE